MGLVGNDGQPLQKIGETKSVEVFAQQAGALELLATLEVTDPPGILLGPKAASRRVQFFLAAFLRSQGSALRAAVAIKSITPQQATDAAARLKGSDHADEPKLAIAPAAAESDPGK